jgi:hypothetical protein
VLRSLPETALAAGKKGRFFPIWGFAAAIAGGLARQLWKGFPRVVEAAARNIGNTTTKGAKINRTAIRLESARGWRLGDDLPERAVLV